MVLGTKITLTNNGGPLAGTEMTPSVAKCPIADPNYGEAYGGGATISKSGNLSGGDVISLESAYPGVFVSQTEEYRQLQAQIDEVEAKLTAWHRADKCSRRLAKIPSVGPIGAVLLRMKAPRCYPVPIGTPVRGLDRFNAKGSFDRG